MARPDTVMIVSATRTAIGRFQGALRDVPVPQLGAAVIREAIRRAGIDPASVDEVLMGNVLQAGVGQAPARQAALAAGLPVTVGATTINKVCGSGLKSAMVGAAMIRAGDAEILVAGGMESMDQAPYLLPRARSGYRLGHATLVDSMIHDGLWCAIEDQHMGEAAEWIAERFDIGRSELDAYALRSHQRAVRAIERGEFRDEIVPVEVPRKRGASASDDPHYDDQGRFVVDECPRSDTSLPRLASLSPVFCPGGLVTAGNASAIADGAAATVLMGRDRADALGCQPLARIVGYAQAAVEPGAIFTAPAHAIQRLLAKTGMTLDDVDLIELNEAFAAQTLANVKALDLDLERVNVRGGAIALGHPIGASGARVLVTLLHALRQRGLARGIAALCLGGGEAVAMMVEIE